MPIKSLLFVIISFFVLSAQSISLPSYIQGGGQSISPSSLSQGATQAYGAVGIPLDMNQATAAPSKTDIIDFYVDEKNYYLGAGDQLTAFIWGAREEQLHIYVAGDGTIVVPSVGAFELEQQSLSEVKQLITKEIQKKYKAKNIDLFLSKLKSVEVAVYGAVKNPGIQRVSGATSVAVVIAKANGFTDRANKRMVLVSNSQTGVDTVDVESFFKTTNASPVYVKSGDRIFVKDRERTIGMSGAITHPDQYDYVEGETLEHLIELGGGLKANADSNRIIVTRFVNDYDSLEKIELTYSEVKSFVLAPEDRVRISAQKEYRESRQVYVYGEVNFPGVYAIREDKSLLVDIIKRAGGLTDQAFPEGSWIKRSDYNDAGIQEYSRLSNLPYNEISSDDKTYLKYRYSSGDTHHAVVSLDFSELIKDGTKLEDIILRSGDVITIAKKSLSVNVMGAVVRPGLVTYKEGASFSYYVQQAGGYKSDAVKRRERVIKAGTEIWIKPRQVDEIAAGDALWIPEKNYVDGMQRTRNVIAVVTAVATTVLAIVSVVNILQN